MASFVIAVFIFILGICLGSFLNVCIYRLPREKSIVFPGSHCIQCEKPILWYDNIPLISFLVLKARCRQCGAKISPRYFLVELAAGVILLCFLGLSGFSGVSLALGIFFLILLGVIFTDFETGYIPDFFTFSGMAAGLAASAFFPALQGETVWLRGMLQSLAGLLTGGILLWVTGLLGNFIYKRDTMGGGDVKLLAMIGAFVGAHKVLLVFFLSPLFSIPYALYIKFWKKGETIPFGPFIALAGALMSLFGERVLRYYGI